MPNRYFILPVIAFILSCAKQQPEEAKVFDEKMIETIAIHDEVMPEMSKINKLIRNLEAKKDSTNADVYEPAIKDLKKGHDMMMDWMKDFGDEFSKSEINEGIKLTDPDSLKMRLDALEKSKKSAEKMKNQVKSAISNAEDILK